MSDHRLAQLRQQIADATYHDERVALQTLTQDAALSQSERTAICTNAAQIVTKLRAEDSPGMMEVFLAEYGLSSDEGIALMCLAEALLRVPDAPTIDALIEDKIAPSNWGRHLGQSTSSLVNASTWALMLTGRVLDEGTGLVAPLRAMVKRLGEPVIRKAVGQAMREMGRQFVLGQDITAALKRAAGMEAKGYTYSYDMLGEAACTQEDASAYHLAYSRAISAIAPACRPGPVAQNPGISIKLSALHPRYERAQKDRVMGELVPRLKALALLAKTAGMGLNIDAEEANRLELSLDVIEAALSAPELAGWDGFGVVIQAYGQRAGLVIDWLATLARKHDRKVMVRLVKGAYWDAEIKQAQVDGMAGFPVFTAKHATDISYIANARKLLDASDVIYPQFATHNAHTMAAVEHIAAEMGRAPGSYEFQRLHGMGEALHGIFRDQYKNRCRIYAPVGAHRDLLAYLVRRLLENGANSSFVNQIVDEAVPAEVVAADPFAVALRPSRIATGTALFAPERQNSKGWDLAHEPDLTAIEAGRAPFRQHQWQAGPLIAAALANSAAPVQVHSPATGAHIGFVQEANAQDCAAAFAGARPWAAPATERAAALRRAADGMEDAADELFALLTLEAGKTLADCVGELREAVDFLRYYANAANDGLALGTVACISPWNFPLAIFAGQIGAALAAGNAVLAKPAAQTPLIAMRAVEIMHAAGIPTSALQLLPGGPETGAALTSDPRLAGCAFTGSTGTAQLINAAMAATATPGAMLIAETGGLNAMIVDSTALPEHAVRDIIASAFQSSGQRCSALRCLYVQEDIAPALTQMLIGAMKELSLGDPWDLATDSGPLIDAAAQSAIGSYVDQARSEGRVLHQNTAPKSGYFIAPTLLSVSSIRALKSEVFGPILHIATFKNTGLDQVIDDINAAGYGLTFGLHTRIDDRVQSIVDRIKAGNIYVNRNQIGAVVGSQPFGGEGVSGTGPKAGGPNYLPRFFKRPAPLTTAPWPQTPEQDPPLKTALINPVTNSPEPLDLPGPTGESNRLTFSPRSAILCLGPGAKVTAAQAKAVTDLGGSALTTAGRLAPSKLTKIENISGALFWGAEGEARAYAVALAARPDAIVPLITGLPDLAHVQHERHICIDTTAAGGNAALLSEIGADE